MELPWSQAYGLPGHLKRGKSKNEYRQVYKNEESANLRFFSRNLDDKLTRWIPVKFHTQHKFAPSSFFFQGES